MKRKHELPECPVATTVELIGSKWKLLIIRNLRLRPWRFNELQRSLEGISQKVLTSSLKEMIDDGLVIRNDFKTNPPHVEYSLSDIALNLLPIIENLSAFGEYYKSLDRNQ